MLTGDSEAARRELCGVALVLFNNQHTHGVQHGKNHNANEMCIRDIHKTKGDIIMQKKFKIEVDCANCAAKIEDA